MEHSGKTKYFFPFGKKSRKGYQQNIRTESQHNFNFFKTFLNDICTTKLGFKSCSEFHICKKPISLKKLF